MISQKNKYTTYTPIKHMNVTKRVLEKLQHQGIKYTRQLLECGQTHQLRKTLASNTGLSLAFITSLVYQADLMRLKAVGGELALLLVLANTTTCQNLQHQQAEQLHRQLALLNHEHHITCNTPKIIQVRSWINEAKLLADTSPETDSQSHTNSQTRTFILTHSFTRPDAQKSGNREHLPLDVCTHTSLFP